MHESIFTQFDPPLRADIKHRAQISRGAAAIFYGTGQFAAEQKKTESRLHVGSFIDDDILGNCSRIPIPCQGATNAHSICPMTWAGFPRSRALGGTSRVTTEPASIQAP